MNRILCLRFPTWPLQRLTASKRELREATDARIVLVHRRDARHGEIIHACSMQAWSCGIRPGMSLSEAKTLSAAASPYLALHDPLADRKWLARIAAWCERYSPTVGWETIAAARRTSSSALATSLEPEALFLDVTGIGVLFGGEEPLARDLLTKIAERKLAARIGIAATIGAAWAATWIPSSGEAESAVTIVPTEESLLALAPLSTRCLRLPEETVELLEQLGVTTIEQLSALPRAGLSARLGEGLLMRLDQAFGRADELIQPYRKPPEYQAERLLEYPLTRRDQIECVLRELIENVALQLVRRSRGVLRFTCRFDVAEHPPLQFTVGLYRPTACARHWEELVRMRLERSAPAGPVGRIGLRVEGTAPLETRQLSLFDGDDHDVKRSVALLIDRLSSRLGEQAVLQARFLRDALPERQVRLVPAADAMTKRSAPSSPPALLAGQRPLFLFSTPQPLEEVFITPEGSPARFVHDRRSRQVIDCRGPERIETGWWRGRCLRRDYYRVELETCERVWLFRRLNDGRWFLHGLFG